MSIALQKEITVQKQIYIYEKCKYFSISISCQHINNSIVHQEGNRMHSELIYTRFKLAQTTKIWFLKKIKQANAGSRVVHTYTLYKIPFYFYTPANFVLFSYCCISIFLLNLTKYEGLNRTTRLITSR